MRKQLIILGLIIFVSCNNDPIEQDVRSDSTVIIAPGKKDTVTVPDTTHLNAAGCYMKVLGRDTMMVQITQVGDSLSGKMIFDNFEKDGSRGTVHGIIKRNTLKLWYDFQSEGMQSVMEIWFRLENKQLIRGIGSFGVKGDTSYYLNPADIQYDQEQVFKKVDCKLNNYQ